LFANAPVDGAMVLHTGAPGWRVTRAPAHGEAGEATASPTSPGANGPEQVP